MNVKNLAGKLEQYALQLFQQMHEETGMTFETFDKMDACQNPDTGRVRITMWDKEGRWSWIEFNLAEES